MAWLRICLLWVFFKKGPLLVLLKVKKDILWNRDWWPSQVWRQCAKEIYLTHLSLNIYCVCIVYLFEHLTGCISIAMWGISQEDVTCWPHAIPFCLHVLLKHAVGFPVWCVTPTYHQKMTNRWKWATTSCTWQIWFSCPMISMCLTYLLCTYDISEYHSHRWWQWYIIMYTCM